MAGSTAGARTRKAAARRGRRYRVGNPAGEAVLLCGMVKQAVKKAAPANKVVKKAAPAKKAAPVKKAAPAKKPAPVRVSTHPPKHRDAAALALFDRLRAICLALPDVTEVLAWAEPTWRVGGRIFAMGDTYHHGSAHLSVHLAAPAGAQAALIDTDRARFFRPPYTGSKGWLGVVLDTDPDWDMVASLVATAHEVIAAAARDRAAGRATTSARRPPRSRR